MKEIFVRSLALFAGTIADFAFLVTGKTSHSFARRYQLWLYRVTYRPPFRIGHKFYLRFRGNFKFGQRCAFGSFTRIYNYCPVIVGDDFIGASGLEINTGSHVPETLEYLGLPVTIGDRVWCGQNVLINPGVTIGNDVVLGSGSVVVKDIPSNCVAVGVPAKIVRHLSREKFKSQFEPNLIPIDSKEA
jgi:acetyltransferase-like isoleucine patch superfamily enzyme